MNLDGVELVAGSREGIYADVARLGEMVKYDAAEIPTAAREMGASVPLDVYTKAQALEFLFDSAPRLTPDERKTLEKKAAKAYGKGRKAPRRRYLVDWDAAHERAEVETEKATQRKRRIAKRELDEEEGGDRPMIADGILDYAALAARPPLRPLIEGVLNVDAVAMLYAPPATFKTFLALWWAACVALGRPWAGRAVEQGPVLYVAAEGVAGIQKRVAALAWLLNRGKPIPDLFIYPAPVNLTSDGEVDEIVALVADRGFRFVIFDTLVKVAGGAEENDNTAMTRVTNAAERIKRAGDGETTVALVHHSGKSGDYRGASALEGNVDTMLKLDGEAGMLTLSAVKQKDGEGGEIIRLRAKPVPEHETLVLEPIGPGDGQPSGMQAARIEEALAHFSRAYATTGVTRSEYVRNLVEWGVAGGPSTAQTYVGDLISSGRLVGSVRGRSTYLELAPERTTFALDPDTTEK